MVFLCPTKTSIHIVCMCNIVKFECAKSRRDRFHMEKIYLKVPPITWIQEDLAKNKTEQEKMIHQRDQLVGIKVFLIARLTLGPLFF